MIAHVILGKFALLSFACGPGWHQLTVQFAVNNRVVNYTIFFVHLTAQVVMIAVAVLM